MNLRRQRTQISVNNKRRISRKLLTRSSDSTRGKTKARTKADNPTIGDLECGSGIESLDFLAHQVLEQFLGYNSTC